MAQLLVRNIDDAVVQSLKRKARLHGRSLEEELRLILSEAAKLSPEERVAVANHIRAMTPSAARQTDSTDLIREDRDRR